MSFPASPPHPLLRIYATLTIMNNSHTPPHNLLSPCPVLHMYEEQLTYALPPTNK